MITKCQVSVFSLLLDIPKAKKRKITLFPLPHFLACAQSNGSTNIKQSKDLCGGERPDAMALQGLKTLLLSILEHQLVGNAFIA